MKTDSIYSRIFMPWLLLTAHICYGQVAVKNYLVSDGLPQSQIAGVNGDKMGNLWLGTIGGGISLFDGNTFSNYNISSGLANDIVMDILPSEKGVWVATQKGITHYENHQFKNYLFDPNAGSYPRKIFAVGDTLFFVSTDKSIGMVLNDSIFQTIQLPHWQGVTSVVKSARNVQVIRQVMGDTHRIIIIQNGSKRVVQSNPGIEHLSSFFRYENEWVTSSNSGLYSIAGDSVRLVKNYGFPLFQYIETTQSFIGKDGGQLVTINDRGKQVIGDFEVLVGSVYNDEDATTWLGTDKGLYRITYPCFIKIEGAAEFSPVMTVHGFKGLLWAGTSSQGVKVYKGSKVVNELNLGSLRRNYVTSISNDRAGTMYIGTGGGIARYTNDGKVEWVAPSLIESSASVAIDKNNRVIVASTVVGAYQIVGTEATVVEGLRRDVIQSIEYNESLDVFAFGTNGGLRIMKGTEVTALKIPQLENIQLSSVRWVSNDLLAIGSYGKGFFLYSFKENKVVTAIDETTGLSSNTVFIIYPDKGKYWIGTIMGLDLVEIQDGNVKGITHFDEADGLLGLETNQDAVVKIDSTLYFGLISGLYKFNNSIPTNPYPLHFTDIKLFNSQPVSRADFSSDENHLTFGFSKVNKRNPKGVYYRYKLEGFDQVWSNVSQSNSITYGNLPDGDFTFKVKTTDKSGTFTFEDIEYNFTISPPFYLTWWFKVIVTLSVLSLTLLGIYVYNRWRFNREAYLQRVKEVERDNLRKEISRDFHDELGNQVARMINYVGLMRISNELKSNAYEALSNYSQTILHGTEDFVWALDPANDDLSNALIHLKDFGERMFVEKGITFSFHGDVSMPQKIPMGFGRQINLIFKEAMTNAFRHSNATLVSLEAIREGNIVKVILRDNGKGIDSIESLNSHRGLENMSVRASRIYAKLTVKSADPGVAVELHLLNLP